MVKYALILTAAFTATPYGFFCPCWRFFSSLFCICDGWLFINVSCAFFTCWLLICISFFNWSAFFFCWDRYFIGWFFGFDLFFIKNYVAIGWVFSILVPIFIY